MQIPYRKPTKFSNLTTDPLLTEGKFDELQKKLEKLKRIQPEAAAEVSRLAELGDFSENAEYQLAKGRLRGILGSIAKLEHHLHTAVIIKQQKTDTVQLGHTVTLESAGKQKTYQILGSTETNPEKGIISNNSPIGAALLGAEVGETVTVTLANKKEALYKIIKIE